MSERLNIDDFAKFAWTDARGLTAVWIDDVDPAHPECGAVVVLTFDDKASSRDMTPEQARALAAALIKAADEVEARK